MLVGDIPPAPEISAVTFGDAGKDMYLSFDSKTNLGNQPLLTSWTCNTLLSFTGANYTTCTWLNTSAIQAVFPSAATGVSLIEINNSVTVRGGLIQPYCGTSTTLCGSAFNFTEQSSKAASTAFNPVTPEVVLIVPTLLGSCDALTVNAAQSTGSGGRNWSTIVWQVTTTNDGLNDDAQAIENKLQSYDSISNTLTVSRSLISAGTYIISLTLTNLFGLSSSGSIRFTAQEALIVPIVSIAGSSSISILTSSALTVYGFASFSSCTTVTSTIRLNYNWKLFLDSKQVSLTSRSRTASQYSLSAYSLAVGSTYTLQLNVTVTNGTSPIVLGSSTASASITIASGNVVAVVTGGSYRQVAEDANLTLSGSSSYDQNSESRTLLSYAWSCTILTFGLKFGDDCSGVIRQQSSSVNVIGSKLSSSLSYGIKLTVSSTDGRSGSTTVTVTSISSGSPFTEITTTATRLNYDSNFTVSSVVQASSDVTVTWSVLMDGQNVTISTNSPLTRTILARYVSSNLPLSLSLLPNTFTPNSVVTFRITAATAKKSAYSEISLLVNAAPVGGSLAVTPTSGSALSTFFLLQTSNWVDVNPSDYLLTYVFTYYQISTLPTLTIQARSTLNTVSAQFPPGLMSLSYKITAFVTAYDPYLAASQPASIQFTVTINNNVDVSNYLDTVFTSAVNSGNADTAIQSLNAVSSTVNIVNCSAMSASYCVALNRNPCADVPNTCGSCLSGYRGVIGAFNSLCSSSQSESSGSGIGAQCATNSNCLYGNCTSYVCVAPDLQCPSSISEAICSGNGDCNYFDFSGAAVNSVCKVTNVTCVARCSCFDGYGGADCSLSSSALTTRDTLRQSLCTGVTSVQGISDDSNLVLTSLATTLQAAYSASEVVTNSSLTTCQSALTSVVSLAVDGYLKDAPPSTAIALVTTTSNFIDSVLNTTSQSASVIDNAVGNIATGLLRAIANDEYPTTIAANNIRLIARRDFIGDLINVSFAPPLTDAEVEYGALGSSLSFTSISNVSECDGGQGYARIAAVTYGINPYPNSSNVQSTIFRFSSQHRDTTEGDDKGDQEQTGRRGRYLLETSPTQLANTTGDYLFSLQFFTEQNFDFNMTIDEAERLGKTNFTFPVCRTYDGDEGQYLACSGCNVSTYNNFNVTFLCDDVTQICDANGDSTTANRRGRRLAWENYLNDMTSSATSSSRRLFVDDDNTDDDYTSFNQGFSIQQYAAIIQAAARVFTSTLNPFHINLKEAAPVLSFVTLLAASMILCGIFLYRMDWLEEHELLENQVWPPTVTSAETVSSFWAIAYKRQSNDEILAKRQAKMMKMSMTDDKLGKQQQDRKKKKQAVFVNYQEAISVHAHHILQAIVPTELVDHNFFRFVWCLIQNHDYLGMFSRPSISQRRFIRYSAFCRSLLLTLLVDTLFFSVFFDDGGQCNSYGTKGMCLERQNKATGQAFCLWQPDGQNSPYTGNCSFREPPSNFIFQIVLALLTMLITLPIDLSIGYIFDQYAAKEADWKLIHMDNMHDDGVVSGHPTNEEEEEHTNKDDQLFLAIEEGEGGVDTSPTEKIIMTVQDSNQRNLFKQYSFSHLTNKTDVVHHESVEEELQHLKRKIASHFEQSATLPFGDSGIQFEAWQQHIKARSDALSSYLGILPSGHMRWMTVREFMLYGNHQRRLMSKLKNVRDQEENLLDHLDQIQDVGSAIRASVLINAFVKEQLTGFKRWVLVNKLGCLDGFLVDRVHPYSWIAAWTFVIAVCIFCLYWIFAWGVTVGTTLIRAWGVNFIIATVQDIFFVCIAKCMIFYMIAMRSIRPQLVTIRDYLRQQLALMQMRQLPLRKRLMMNNERGFSVVQTLSPACRAAGYLLQTEETRFSSSADAKMDPKIAILKLLRMIDDYDIVRCREVRSNKLTWIAIFIAFSPIVFVLFGEVMTDLTLDMIMPTISSAFLILNAILNAINPAILAIPYIVLAFVLLYYFGLIPLAKYEHKRWKKRVWNHRDEAISAQLLRPMMSRRKAWQESSFVREMCDLVLEGIAFIVYYTSWRLQRDEHKNRIGGKRRVWRLVNIPSHLKPREEAVRYVATSLHDVVSLDDEEKEHGNSNSKNEDDDIDTSKTNESYDDEEGEEAGSPNRISSFRDIIERESPPPSTAAKKQATQQPLIMLPPEILKLVSGQWAVALDHNVDTNDDIHSNDPLVIAKLKAKKMKRSSLKAAKKIANNIPAPLPSLPSSLLPQPLADALSSSLLSFKIRRSSNALNDVDLAPAPASSPPPVADILPRPRRIKYTEDTPSIINLQQQMIEAFCQHQDPERSDGEVKKLAKEMLANESTKGPADLLPTEYLIDLLSEVLTSTPRVVGLGLSDEQREEVLRNVQQSVVATAAGEEILFADFICLCLCPTLSDMDDLRFDGNEEVEEDDDEEEKADDDEVGEEKKADENERKEEGRFSPRKLATRLSGAVQRIQESLRVGQEEERDVPNIIDIGEQLISRISDSFQQMQVCC